MFASPPTARPAASRLRVRPLFDRSLRLAVILVIVATGGVLLQTYRTMLHETPVAPSPSLRQGERLLDRASIIHPLSALSPSALLQPGAWTLGDSSWQIRVGDLVAAGGDDRLISLGSSEEGGQLTPPLESKILFWLQRFHPAYVRDRRVFDVRLGQLRVRAVTRSQGKTERLQLMQVVWRPADGPAQLLEANPAPLLSRRSEEEGHLLPLPPGVTSLARRWDEAGRLSCEILGPAMMNKCLRGWSAAGWTTEKVGETGEMLTLFVLRKGGRVIQLCSLEAESANSPAYLLLTVQSAE